MLSGRSKWRKYTGSGGSVDDSHDVEARLAKLKRVITSTHSRVHRDLPGHSHFHRIFHGTRLDRRDLGIDCDEVYPNLFIGDEGSARNKSYLKLIGITHVVNTAEGSHFSQIDTGAHYYSDVHIKYMGLNLLDIESTKISIHFGETAEFIDRALLTGGRVLIHCYMGLSRSSTIALAYLMIKKGMTAEEALRTARQSRSIRPNDGFLRQLIDLEFRIRTAGGFR
ncbi:dual specificity protein phosphatase 3-like [Panonychus citri]|uniref:dual specificity protein phosphatase 3-like n=1 Tax=Panonychus citri TaxID=50023 RepID=UPI0023083276|nr:dual specificity protein phosphatase 3-like [Panonychus citri]